MARSHIGIKRFAKPVRRTCPPDQSPRGWRFVNLSKMLRLDYLSCVLTIVSTVLVGKKMWHGWIVAGVNSVVICWIGIRTAQFGFVAANLFCVGLYANNLSQWRPKVLKRSNAESRLPLPTLS